MINLIDRDDLIEKLLETESDDIENTDFNIGYVTAIDNLIDLLYNAPVIHTNWVVDWIPCSEKLPEKDEAVLIYACGHRAHAYYDKANDCFRLSEDENLYYKKENVTHWIPLPDTPEQKTCETVWTNADSLRHMIGIDNEEFIHKIGTNCDRCAYINGACNCECRSGNMKWLNQPSDYKGLKLDFMKGGLPL